jgi:hypothetical protein
MINWEEEFRKWVESQPFPVRGSTASEEIRRRGIEADREIHELLKKVASEAKALVEEFGLTFITFIDPEDQK